MMKIILSWYIVSLISGIVMFRVLVRTITSAGHVRMNFQGRDIPTSLGMGFVFLTYLMFLVMSGVTSAMNKDLTHYTVPLLVTITGFGFLGLLDDIVVGREKGGFKGHLARFGKTREVSTALLKAGFGFIIAFSVSSVYWRGEGWVMVFVDSIIIALLANAMNMLDVRPGRTAKGFLTISLFIFLISVIGHFISRKAGIMPITWLLIFPYLIWVLCYIKTDLSCDGMMGDTGSNVLGAVLGVLVIWEISPLNRWFILGILIGFQLLTEVTSISAIIEKVRILKAIDNFGVKQNK